MKEKYVMPEIEQMQKDFNEFYEQAQEFIRKMKEYEKEQKNEIA